MNRLIVIYSQAISQSSVCLTGTELIVSKPNVALNILYNFIEIICFNYLQQRFYLVEPTMKSLAKGASSEAIYKLLKVVINT